MDNLPQNPIDRFLLPYVAQLRGNPFSDAVWRFCATKMLMAQFALLAIVFASTWSGAAYQTKLFALYTVAALVVNEAVSWGIGYVYFRLRPFVARHEQPLVGMNAFTKSFPSDHATITFTIASVLMLIGPAWGTLALGAAVLVSLGRVIAGVHYPTDVIAGALLGWFGTRFVFLVAAIYGGLQGVRLFGITL